MNIGDLVLLKKERKEHYATAYGVDLGLGIVVDEFENASGDLYFQVYWSIGVTEWIRPSWLVLIRGNRGTSPTEGE